MTPPETGPAPSLLGVLGEPVALVWPGSMVLAPADAAERAREDWSDSDRWRWWVAAGNRWHRPEQEAAVRVSSPDGTPVIHTAMRVPGGDVRVVSFAAVVNGAAAVVLEVHNDSASPVLFTLVNGAVAPIGGRTRRFRAPRPAELVDHVECSRSPDDVLTAPSIASLVEMLKRFTVSPVPPEPPAEQHREPSFPSAGTATARLFALSVGARLRAVVASRPGVAVAPTADRSLAPTFPGPSGQPGVQRSINPLLGTTAVPSGESVSAGWRRQIELAGIVDGLDEQVAAQLLSDRCHLLIDARARHPAVVASLAAWGHLDAAVERLDGALTRLDAPVEGVLAAMLLEAAADLVAWVEEPERLVRALTDTVLELAAWVGPGAARPRSHQLVSRFADAATALGAGAGPADLRPVWQPWPPGLVTNALCAQDGQADGGTFGSDPALEAAGRLLSRRRELLGEPAIGEIDLLLGWQDAWRGLPIEAHRMPTHLGPLSFALRWHGPRPALLWQLERRPGTEGDGGLVPLVRCPVLDPAFTGRGWQGEALLG